MKIKMYILTYDSEYHINDSLNQIFTYGLDGEIELNIINNHSNLQISEQNKKRLEDFGNYKILHNVMQSDTSWGYTTRNWNQALILGFKSLNNPDCDVVICAQDDTLYNDNWLRNLKARHEEGLEFISAGLGDCFCSYTPEAVKAIGLWDERFCTLNFSEYDYMLRAASWLGYKAAIDDNGNSGDNDDGGNGYICRFNGKKAENIARKAEEEQKKKDLRNIRMKIGHQLGGDVFVYKWGKAPGHPDLWARNNVGNCIVPVTPMFVNYPYFEKEIPNIRQKGYMFL